MIENKVKTILNLSSEQESTLLTYFQSWELAICQLDNLGEIIPDFILFSSMDLLEAELLNKYPQAQLVSLAPVSDLAAFAGKNGRILVNEEMLNLPIYRLLLQRFFSKQSSKNLEQAFGNLFQTVNHCKISGHSSIGYYMDLLAMPFVGSSFDVVGFRNYFLHLMTFFNYLRQTNIGGFPISVETGVGQEELVIQCEMSVFNFQLEILLEAFQEQKKTGTINGLLKECYHNCDNFDIYYLEKKSSLVITGLWKKGGTPWRSTSFSSLVLQNIYQFEYQKNRIEKMLSAPLIFLQNLEKDLPWDQQLLPSIGNEAPMIMHPSFLLQLINFILEKRTQEENPKALAELELIDVDRYLMDYSQQEIVNLLSMDDKIFILKSLLNNDHIDRLKQLLELAQDDIVMGGNQEQVEKTIIKAINQLEPDQYKVIIKGEELSDSQWFDKRSKFAESVKIFLNDSQNNDIQEEKLKQHVMQLAQEELAVDEAQSVSIVDEIWDETVREQVDQQVVQQLYQNLNQEALNRKSVSDLSVYKELELKTEQLENLQKLVSTLKVELGALKNIKTLQEGEGDNKAILLKMGRQLEVKEKLITHLKEVQMDLAREKDKKISQIEEKSRQYFRELQKANGHNEVKVELDKIKKDRDNLNKIIGIKDEIIKKLHSDYKKNEVLQKQNHVGVVSGGGASALDLRELNEKKIQVGKLQEEVNQNQERLKVANFKIKQLEGQVLGFQKLMDKKKTTQDATGNSDVAKAIEGKYQLKLKTLEKMNEKLTEEQKKAGKLVADAKKDLIKYRAELNTATNRIKELERKLGIK